MRRFFSISWLTSMMVLVAAGAVMAAEGAVAGSSDMTSVAAAIGAALAIGIAAAAGAFAQGKAAAAGLKGIARNPGASGKITTTMIIGLALIESLVIYALVISFILMGKVK